MIRYGSDYVERYRKKKGEGRLERMLTLFELGRNNSVLDVGCGNGFLADLVNDKVKKYTGIDTSGEFIKEAKKNIKYSNCFFYNDSSRNHLRRNTKYDRIFLMDVSEHMTDKIFLEVLRDFRFLLNKDGRAYIHTPNKDYFLERLKQVGLLRQTFGHIAVRTPLEYSRLLKKAGYKVEIRYLDHYLGLLGCISFLKYIPIFGRLFNARLFIKFWKDEG